MGNFYMLRLAGPLPVLGMLCTFSADLQQCCLFTVLLSCPSLRLLSMICFDMRLIAGLKAFSLIWFSLSICFFISMVLCLS